MERPALRTQLPAPTPVHRLWFGWSVTWGILAAAVLSPPLVLHSAFRPTARTLLAWMKPWGRIVLTMAGIRVEVEHRAPLPDGPVVFVSNHVNLLDIPIATATLPRPFLFVARHELRDWPLVGWVLDKTACLFIARDNPRQAVADLRAVADRIRGGESVMLYPEGGRSYGHEMLPFMRGPFVLAIEAGVPIVPITVVGHAGVFDRQTSVARPGRTRFVIGAPIETAALKRGDAAELADQVRAVLDAELTRFAKWEDSPRAAIFALPPPPPR